MKTEEAARLLEEVLGGCAFSVTVERVRDTTLSYRAEASVRLSTEMDRKSLGRCQAAGLREIYREGTWRSGEWGERLKIEPQYDGAVASCSASKIDSLLDGYLDSEEAHIGHVLAESINGSEFGRYEGNRIAGLEKVSSLNEFRDYLVIGAALLGSGRMAEHLTAWLAGEPLRYRTIALLVGARIEASLAIEPGIRVEKLPANTRDLPQSVLGLGSAAPATYLGGVVLCVDCEVVPPLYRPEKGTRGSWNFSDDVRHSWALGTASIDEFCETLSLSANGCIRGRQVWRDYGELEAFSALTARMTDPLKAIHGGVAVESLTEEHLREAWDIQCRRNVRKDGAIGMAIGRWVNSKRPESSLADRFIELRIALEALYLDGKSNTEMGFRLATHGALYAGGTIEERRRSRETLREAYNLSSRAVHAGTLKPSSEGVLKKAQEICREGIVKRLREDDAPDWSDLILGAE